jgi:Zn-dependent peptidase ImmA (M78 family)
MFLGVRLLTPKQIPGLSRKVIDQLLKRDPSGWSAVGVTQGDLTHVIYNPTHSEGRQASDIMHELAHIILDHEPATIIIAYDGSLSMRSYNQTQEDEASWLAWCLLLPREALLWCKRRAISTEQIAEDYGVSETLVTFRLRVTGIEAQLRAVQRFAG